MSNWFIVTSEEHRDINSVMEAVQKLDYTDKSNEVSFLSDRENGGYISGSNQTNEVKIGEPINFKAMGLAVLGTSAVAGGIYLWKSGKLKQWKDKIKRSKD